MKKNLIVVALAAGCMLMSSCALKKDLDNCRLENNTLSGKYQDAREQLASANARIQSLEEQLATARKGNDKLQGALKDMQNSLNQSLSNASSNNVNISKLVDQINESNQYIRHLVDVKTKSDSLNLVLTNNLTRSLSKEELKEVDVQEIGRAHV